MPTLTYNYTGAWQTFVVPAGVTAVTVDLRGGGVAGRAGGRVTGRLAVSPGQTLYLVAPGAGKPNSGSTGGAASFGGGNAGGDGRSGHAGGDGGAGAAQIRLNSRTGTIKCVAGGAGGTSGDSGAGGRGGAATGEAGSNGTAGAGSTGTATGGTQIQGGNGGTSTAGVQFNGGNGQDAKMGLAGRGGSASAGVACHGGGGGGGGYYSGGGGQASAPGVAPGGGGGAGSNFTGGLTGATSTRAGGSTGNGQVFITYSSPTATNQPPSVPTDARINNIPESDQYPTKSTGSVKIDAVIDDPDAGQSVRLLVRYASNSRFVGYVDKYTAYHSQNTRTGVTLTGLKQDTLYYVRLYTQDSKGLYSTSYNSLTFWTNRHPSAPIQLTPAPNVQFDTIDSVEFTWTHVDPDPGDGQRAFQLEWRKAATSSAPAGPATRRSATTSSSVWVENPFTFKSNTFYEWRVVTQDPQNRWGVWSDWESFYITGTSTPPVLLEPIDNSAIDTTVSNQFRWRFRDPDPGDAQTKADFRYRVYGTEPWTELINHDQFQPGSDDFWIFPEDTFIPGYRYEWQVRTYGWQDPPTNTVPATLPSEWSDSEHFWTVASPGNLADGDPVPTITTIKGALGCGQYRVFVYERGGTLLRGEITPIAHMLWHRKRDDISNALITTNGFGDDCCQLLSELECWIHEVVIFRDDERVWEGPITRITETEDGVEIEAKDVMAYVYRRIMRQGYNDAYRIVNNEQVGLKTVVERAARITMNALAPSDPNVLPYLTVVNNPGDARQSRVVPDFSRTAWEEIDDLAATAGLDYTVVGRRIIYWDTHRAIGLLPEMRNEDFSSAPIITQYGMQLATLFAVTNNNGVAGYTTPILPGSDPPRHMTEAEAHAYYGPIEQLASAYGEAAGGPTETLTQAALSSLRDTLTSQAARNIANRWPTPVVVRVPDNSALSVDTNVGINQLVPGVWIPLRAETRCRSVAQIQKLDAVTVEVTDGGEAIRVTMSPAPNGGQDLDAEQAAIEE